MNRSLAIKTLLAFMMLLVMAAAPPRPQGDPPVAVVVSLDGPVRVQAGDATPRAATVGTRLTMGDRVLPGEGGRAVLLLSTGATRVVTHQATIQAPEGDRAELFSRTVRALSRAADSPARSRPNRQGMIRPVSGAPEIVSPRNDIPVRSVRPTFSWIPAEGQEASEYRIQIREEGGDPIRFHVGEATTWTLPEEAPALTPGATYWWTVGPRGRGRPSREMQFQVLSLDRHDALNEQMGALLSAGLDPEGDGAFMAAVIYREAGLYYDAARSLDFLEEKGGPLGVNALLLKGEIMDFMGDLEAARDAFDAADRLGDDTADSRRPA